MLMRRDNIFYKLKFGLRSLSIISTRGLARDGVQWCSVPPDFSKGAGVPTKIRASPNCQISGAMLKLLQGLLLYFMHLVQNILIMVIL